MSPLTRSMAPTKACRAGGGGGVEGAGRIMSSRTGQRLGGGGGVRESSVSGK
jgi:hypothetical protein